MAHKITVGLDGDPFLVPVELPGCTFSLQVHELMAASVTAPKGADGGVDMAALVRQCAIPPGSADGAKDASLVAVYWQAANIVGEASKQGNG